MLKKFLFGGGKSIQQQVADTGGLRSKCRSDRIERENPTQNAWQDIIV